MGTQLPPPKKKGGGAEPPQFSDHVSCGQKTGWIRMPLDMEVSLDPGHTVLDGDPAPLPKKGGTTPKFWPMCPNGWIDQDATWYGGRPRLRPRCIRWAPSSSPTERGTAAPTFRPMSIEPNGRRSQQLLTSCTFADSKNIFGKLLQKV